MGRITHLTRRGAVYYWRGRVQLRRDSATVLWHWWVSLRTRELKLARCRAARMTAEVESRTMQQGFVTEQQLAEMAANALASHVEPLKRHAALMRFDRTYDPAKEAADDRVTALTFDLLATFGPERRPTFHDDCPVRQRLVDLGATEAVIEVVASDYEAARATAMYEAGPGARRHLANADLSDDPTNMALAYNVLVRARADALRERAESRFPRTAPDLPKLTSDDEAQTALLREAVSRLRSTIDGMQTMIMDASHERPEGRALPIEQMGEEIEAFVAMKLSSGRWRAKKHGLDAVQSVKNGRGGDATRPAEPARNHAKATLQVFLDFLRMKEVSYAHEVDQAIVADFLQLLNQLPTHYRRSRTLRALSLTDLIVRTEDDTECQRGLDAKTTRRHAGDVGQFWTYLKGQGRSVRSIDFAAVKPPKPRRLPSDDAQKWQPNQLERFLHAPVFTGCVSAAQRGEPGPLIIRDGAFFVPLIALLMGLRREEAAGLETDAVGYVERIPVLHLRANVVRDLKTLKSRRTVPIHHELVRLGFLRLASLRRKNRQRLLFPELVSSSSVAMGDKVYDTLVEAIGPVSPLDGSTLIPRPIHGLRHWCNVAMKDASVPSEVRDDILGKRGLKESEDRYARPAKLERMWKSLHAAECVTDHIPRWRSSEIV